jgi:hypothetical protein
MSGVVATAVVVATPPLAGASIVCSMEAHARSLQTSITAPFAFVGLIQRNAGRSCVTSPSEIGDTGFGPPSPTQAVPTACVPVGQELLHMLDAHTTLPPVRGGQTVPHLPQLALSRVRSTQAPEQLVRPAMQLTAHAPDEHT